MDDQFLIWGLRLAGVMHFVTLVLACVTPIPPDWEKNLAKLPDVHRRFAVAQNAFIGGVIVACGLVSALYAPLLIGGSPLARAICGFVAAWWGGRLVVLPWLRAHQFLTTPLLRIGFAALLLECALFTVAYGYLAVRASPGAP